MLGTNTPTTSVFAHLVKPHKICSRTHSFRDEMKNKFLFPLACGPTRTLIRSFKAGIHFPQILDQLVHTVETKKNDTRVLQRLDSSHGKCSYPEAEDCFYRQWCYLSASMRLFLPTLIPSILPPSPFFSLPLPPYCPLPPLHSLLLPPFSQSVTSDLHLSLMPCPPLNSALHISLQYITWPLCTGAGWSFLDLQVGLSIIFWFWHLFLASWHFEHFCIFGIFDILAL